MENSEWNGSLVAPSPKEQLVGYNVHHLPINREENTISNLQNYLSNLLKFSSYNPSVISAGYR